MPIFQQIHEIPAITPHRIVSLVPSLTELLFDLGLECEVVGITRFCVHPPHWRKTKCRIGGTKKVDIEKIVQLAPTLIIANREENVKEQVEQLAVHCSVWLTDVYNVSSAMDTIHNMGCLLGRVGRAASLIASIQKAMSHWPRLQYKPRVAYFIWRNPWMSVGGDTYIHDVLQQLGLYNVFGNLKRYPVVNPKMLCETDVDFILLSSEPFPFTSKHVAEAKHLWGGKQVVLVNGEWFSWYGSRMVTAFEALGPCLSNLCTSRQAANLQ